MNDDQRALVAEAVLGRDATEFCKSDIGRYMLTRAAIEEHEAIAALAMVSPWRRRRIMELQAKLWRAKSFRGWLAELMNTGVAAEEQLEGLSD